MKSPPLGLAYIAAVAEQAGHEVRIIDSPTLGLSNEELISRIVNYKPEVLGIGATTLGYADALGIIAGVRARLPRTFIVMGGPHVTFTDEETLRECPALDAVVRGEGEETFKELLDVLSSRGDLSRVAGLTYRDGERILRNQDRPFIKDLDSVPFPAFHLLPMEKYYMVRGMPFACMMSSRGCPFRCSFCSSSSLFGKTWRFRSAENVVAEMEYLKKRYGIRQVEIVDDTFTVNRSRVHKICDLLIKKNLGLTWATTARVGSFDEELARKMKKAGCVSLYLGFESASQRVLDSLCKGIKLEQAWKTMETVRRVGLETVGSFIIGSLADTVKSIRKTIRFARALSPNYAQFTLLTPYPGTPLYKEAKERGLITSKDWSRFTILEPVLKHPTIPAKILRRYLNWAYISFYLRPRYILQEIRKRNLYLVPRAIKALIDLLLRRGLFRKVKE